MAWKLGSWVNRITGDVVAAADINDAIESIYALVGNGTSAPSQTLEQVIAGAVATPPGGIISYAGISSPTGWLLCDGASYLRADYTGLVGAIIVLKGTATISIASPGVVTLATHGLITGDRVHLTTDGALPTGLTASTDYWVIYNDANTFWLATTLANAVAGTKINTSGTQSGTHTLYRSPYGIADSTHFNVPDAVEASFVGLGTRGAGVTAHDTYALGQFKDDQGQSHKHQTTITEVHAQAAAFGIGGSVAGERSYATNTNNSELTDVPRTDGTNGTPRTGTTTHGKLLGINYIIKT